MSGKRRFVLLAVLALTMTGFVLGNAVNAAISSPGTDEDPLVTKSYVDGQVNKLQEQIDTLKAEVEELKGKVQ